MAALQFPRFSRRKIDVSFNGGDITSNGGVQLLRLADERTGLIKAAVRAIGDSRRTKSCTHALESLVRQRVYGISLGYEDLGLFDGPDATSPLLFATGLVGRDAGMNIFDLIPFAGPLAPGSYMLLFEQTQFDASPYEISLVVDQTPIPLPLPVVLLGSALVLLVRTGRVREYKITDIPNPLASHK